MSVYSNVNYYKLQNDVNAALNELSTYSASTLMGNIESSKVLSSNTEPNCKSNIKKAAQDICDSGSLKNGSINKLKKELNNLKNIAGYIKLIKDLESEIAILEKQLYDAEGKKDINIENRINSKKQSIKHYESMI